MEIQSVKDVAEKCVSMAQTLLARDRVLTPIAISVRTDGEPYPTLLDMGNQDQFSETLWELSLACDGMIFIFEYAFVEALMCVACVKGHMAIRVVLHNGFDPGWIDVKGSQGYLENLFRN